MADTIIDFDGSAGGASAANADVNAANQPDTTNLNGGGAADITSKDNNNATQTNQPNGGTGEGNDNHDNNGNVGTGDNNNNDNSSTGELEVGTEVEYDGAIYTVAENGDLVDKDGKVFKEAKDVQNWLKENNFTDSTDEDAPITIDSIREAVGIDVTDENGNPVEFTDDAKGVKSYIDSVIALNSSNIAQGAVNKLFADNPLLKQFIDYVQVNGSPSGFGDIPDRSTIQLDKDNQMQQEAIIRMAAKEFGNMTINDTYIKYLKDSGALYDEAKNQLQALIGKDKAYRKQIEDEAAARRLQNEKEIKEYWEGVSKAINNKVIGGHKLPDSITKEINGQKITLTLDDFYKYVSEAKEVEGSEVLMTGYQRDLNKLSNDEALAKELLDAWLMFTGGSYKDLINMADNEDKVRKLVVKSKQQRSARTIKVNKPNQGKTNTEDIVLS